ncbi:hypothetical protein ACF06X_31665 [Streptomyces sp. NPDC015346]|uniref:hypothetical protein n=1 Tax=Streptomyces sp. NPDC015346 TaxID=3364954 RepID=UPI0036FD68BB
MTPDLSHSNPAEDDIDQTAGPAKTPAHRFAVSAHPPTSLPNIPARPTTPPAVPGVPVVAAALAGPEHPDEAARPVTERHEPVVEPMRPEEAPAPAPAPAPARAPAPPPAPAFPPAAPAPAPAPAAAPPPAPAETKVEVQAPVPAEAEAPPPAPAKAEEPVPAEDKVEARAPAPAPPPAPAPAPAEVKAEVAGTEVKAEARTQTEPQTQTRAEPQTDTEAEAEAENGDEAVHTLLWTAATERPVEEVASLVARLKETGQVSSPADVALRAAAVSRPLDEVRQLLALLNASGYDLHQAETTLRAAAVGRSIEDVVQLVNILGTDSSDWRPISGGGDGKERKAGPGQDEGAKADKDAVPVLDADQKRRRGGEKRSKSVLDGALATGPGSHTSSPALRSALRWPATIALFACGLIHVPMDLAGLRSGGNGMLSVVITVLCLLCAVWLAVRDTLIVWAAAAGLAVGVIALHGLASARTVDLLDSSLGSTFAWAKATALLSAVAVVVMAGSAVVRHTRTTSAPDSA